MLKGLTRAGIGAISSYEQYIALASQHGFQSVDLDAQDFIHQVGSAHAANALLQHYGIVIGSIGLSIDWRTSAENFRSGIVGLAESAAAAAALGCTRCCTHFMPSVDIPAAHFMALATKRLRLCARILNEFNIRLGLEFVGVYHLRKHGKYPFIWTMEETLDWIEAIGEPNVGLLLDAYHWYTTGASTKDIEQLRLDQIVHVHINDAADIPIADLHDNKRLYPGEGVIDLADFLKSLQKIGYSGSISQEILASSPPADCPEVLFLRSQKGFAKIFAAAGLE